jgi:hypothetical protein
VRSKKLPVGPVESGGYVEPWCAPTWAGRYNKPGAWHDRLTLKQTENMLYGERSMFDERLKNVLEKAEDEARIELACMPPTIDGSRKPVGSETAPDSAPDSKKKSAFSHSRDYRNIRYKGRAYLLTPQQAKIIEAIDEPRQRGIYQVGIQEIRQKSSCGKISDSFRSGDGRKLWMRLLVPVKHCRGFYALNLPAAT